MDNGIFSPLTSRDLLKTSNRKLAEKVAGLWDKHVALEADYMVRDNVILEGVGHWLKQNAWTDDTGFFLKLRLHPLYKHKENVRESGRKVVQGFIDLFPGEKQVIKEGHLALEYGTEDTITVVVKTGFNMIGD